jgi:hypothetical protein
MEEKVITPKSLDDVICDLDRVIAAVNVTKEYAFSRGENAGSDEGFSYIFGTLQLACEKLDTIRNDVDAING